MNHLTNGLFYLNWPLLSPVLVPPLSLTFWFFPGHSLLASVLSPAAPNFHFFRFCPFSSGLLVVYPAPEWGKQQAGPLYIPSLFPPSSFSSFAFFPPFSSQRREALVGSQCLRRKAAWAQSWSFHSFLSLPALPISPSNRLLSWSIRSLQLSLAARGSTPKVLFSELQKRRCIQVSNTVEIFGREFEQL